MSAFYLQYHVNSVHHAAGGGTSLYNPANENVVIGVATVTFVSHAGNGWQKIPAGSLGVSRLRGGSQQYGTLEFYLPTHVAFKVASGQHMATFSFSGVRFEQSNS